MPSGFYFPGGNVDYKAQLGKLWKTWEIGEYGGMSLIQHLFNL